MCVIHFPPSCPPTPPSKPVPIFFFFFNYFWIQGFDSDCWKWFFIRYWLLHRVLSDCSMLILTNFCRFLVMPVHKSLKASPTMSCVPHILHVMGVKKTFLNITSRTRESILMPLINWFMTNLTLTEHRTSTSRLLFTLTWYWTTQVSNGLITGTRSGLKVNCA